MSFLNNLSIIRGQNVMTNKAPAFRVCCNFFGHQVTNQKNVASTIVAALQKRRWSTLVQTEVPRKGLGFSLSRAVWFLQYRLIHSDTEAPNVGIWDNFADAYDDNLGDWAMPSFATLSSVSNLRKAKAVIEVGCGAGRSLPYLRTILQPSCKYIGTDISTQMLAKAESALQKVQLGEKDFYKTQGTGRWVLEQCGAQSICHRFSAGSFDRYLSNLCLNFTPDPTDAINQACRVLEPGGIAAISVWGSRTNSNMLTLLAKAARQLQLPVVDKNAEGPSPFDLGNDHQKLRETFLAAGFQKVVIWNALSPISHLDGSAYASQRISTMPNSRAYLESISIEQKEKLLAKLTKEADEIITSGQPLGVDIVYALARR